jgi:signal transduction histidine kinase/HAMP domain-containing protein
VSAPEASPGSEPRRPLARRVLTSFAVVVLAFLATIASGLFAQRRGGQDLAALTLGYLPLETALARGRSVQWTVAARLDRLLDDPHPEDAREWLETVARGRPAVLAEARAAVREGLTSAADDDTRELGASVSREIEAIELSLAEDLRALPDLFGALRAQDVRRATTQLASISARERGAAERLDVLAGRIGDRRKAVVKNSVTRDSRSIAISLALALLSLGVAALATREVGRRLSPLARLTDRAKAIAAGDRSPLPVDLLDRHLSGARDEITELAVAFGSMVEGVARRDADLLRLRRRQEDIVNHLRAAVLALRGDGTIEAANPAARSLLGAEVGRPLGEAAPHLHRLVGDDLARAIAGQEPPARTGITLEGTRGAEGRLVVDLRVVPMAESETGERLALLVVDDVSEAAAARTRALQAERLAAIGKMAAHITHEIRNPLSSIGLNVELLEETIAGADDANGDVGGDGGGAAARQRRTREAQQLRSALAREVGRLADVSDDYLRVARLPQPRLQPIDLRSLVRDVVEFAGPELERARVAVELALPEAPESEAFIAADEGQVRQALVNLVRNAREAMEDGGRLRVSLRADASTVTLSIEDEGPGIDEDVRLRIFDPFFTTKSTGTGLGLPITKQIVEAHGGTIACEAGEERGTRFALTFPRARAATAAEGELDAEG